MNNDTTPAPDYGEPWSKSTFYAAEEHTNLGTIRRRDIEDHAVVFWCQPDPDTVDRIIACVNACPGMSDPAAEIAAMRARIAKLEAAQEWRPMHDAPRDGMRILGITENGFCDVIYWSKRTNDFVGKWSPFVAWMPLPPRPAAINKALKEEQP